MTAERSIWTRIRHAIFGAPQTHEQAQAMHRADPANRGRSAEVDARARSISTQMGIGL